MNSIIEKEKKLNEALLELKNLDLSNEVLVQFDDKLDISTIEAELNLMLNTKSKENLFRGQYKDVITFVIADL